MRFRALIVCFVCKLSRNKKIGYYAAVPGNDPRRSQRLLYAAIGVIVLLGCLVLLLSRSFLFSIGS